MTTTDQQATARPPTLDDRLDAARAKWERLEDERLSALADYLALLAGKPAPSDGAHVDRFASDVRGGDHVLWEGAWWYVTGATGCTPDWGPIGSGARLTLSRVGREPVELRLGGDALLTTVRATS